MVAQFGYNSQNMSGGCEWVVEAHGCDPEALSEVATLQALFAQIVEDLDLHPIAEANWHKFAEPGGVTAVTMLRESHLACHTFPEYRTICLNLFCCRPRAEWDFEAHLKRHLGAATVHVRRIERPYSA
jgi:S-adenosylmethionine decarboxylase